MTFGNQPVNHEDEPMNSDNVDQIALALQRAGAHRRLMPYQRFHALFVCQVPLAARYEALERAVASLAQTTALDYGVLLALDNGLPGAEFFRRFRRNRYADYLAVMGNGMHEQSLKRKRVLAAQERDRVFADAERRAPPKSREAA
ncbi:MAG TPA: hypothetical protein VFE79_16170 [Paraburkholderia sp.]|jgi:hypothetical protein|nr:hypothetical protein [Paraburkholderia sp.]